MYVRIVSLKYTNGIHNHYINKPELINSIHYVISKSYGSLRFLSDLPFALHKLDLLEIKEGDLIW